MKLTSTISISEGVPNLHFLVFDNLMDFNTCWFYCISPLCVTTTPPLNLTIFVARKGFTMERRKPLNATTSLCILPMTTPKTLQAPVHPEGYQHRACTAALVGSSHSSVLLRCKPRAAPVAALLITLLEVVLGENFQEKVEILLPLTHRICIPRQQCSVVHYWRVPVNNMLIQVNSKRAETNSAPNIVSPHFSVFTNIENKSYFPIYKFTSVSLESSLSLLFCFAITYTASSEHLQITVVAV